MLTRIIIFLLVVGLVYLNYTTPKVEEHQAFLLAELEQSYPVPEDMREKLWRKTDYSNFMVCSVMKTREGSTMISYGFLKRVKLVDTEWVDKVKKQLQRREEIY